MDISNICLEWNQKLINSDSIKLSIDQLMLRLNKNQIKNRIHMLLGKNKKTKKLWCILHRFFSNV